MVKQDAKFTQELREFIKKWDDNWRFNTQQYHEFVSFVMGSQWTEDESKLFIDYKKIPLSFNKLAPLINHLLGEQRQNTPNLQVVPDEGVPLETAKVREALVKDISLNSDSKRVYQTAFQQASIGGFGAFLIDTEYKDNRSFDLVIVLREVKDPTHCYWDISAESPSKTDGMRAGQRFRMSRKMFAKEYGEDIEKQIGTQANYDEGSATGWIFSNDKEITVIRDYQRIYSTKTIYQLSNGRTVDKKELDSFDKVMVDDKEMLVDTSNPYMMDYVTIEQTRQVPEYKIEYKLCAGEFILEERDFPSEQLPVIFVDQNSYYEKSGKQICRPFIKDARDSQRYLNYIGTQSAYIMRVTRYDQYLVSKANVRSPDTELIWRDPSTARGGLTYDESPNGNVPIQLKPAELPMSLITQYQRAMSDIESCTGMYGTQMGEQGNEISGTAIDARTRRGNYNTYVPFDALNRAIACCGTIINEMIPIVYDTERKVSLHMPDTGTKEVVLNKQADIYGSAIENNMRDGNYKVRLLPGASFEGQKMENLESMQSVLKADPSLFRLIADLYIDNLPMANNIEMKNRVRTVIPPEIVEAGKTGKPLPPKQPEIPPEMQIKMQELEHKKQVAMMEYQLKVQEITMKEKELQLKAVQTGQDISVHMHELENKKLEAATKLREQEMRYSAEMTRAEVDLKTMHHDNFTKLLMHKKENNAWEKQQ